MSVPLETVGKGYVMDTQFDPQGNVITTGLVGHWMVAGGTARTSTTNVQEEEPQAFVAVQMTVLRPSGRHEPEAGTQSIKVPLTITGKAYETGAQFEQVKRTRFVGQVMEGGLPWPWMTCNGNSQPTTWPQLLVARQITL